MSCYIDSYTEPSILTDADPVDLSNYYTKAESDARYSLLAHNHDGDYYEIDETIAVDVGNLGSGSVLDVDGNATGIAEMISVNVTNGSNYFLRYRNDGTELFSINAASGSIISEGSLQLGDALRLNGTSYYTEFLPSGLATGNQSYTLPPSDGTSGYVLSTNGSGTLSWIAPSGGGLTTEEVNDIIGAVIVGGTGITATVDDGADTVTLSLTDTPFTQIDADLLYRPIGYVPTWAEVTGKPSFATVATSGDYNDLINLPDLSSLNDVVVYVNLASFPGTGSSDFVYIAEDTGYMYRWNGSGYTQLTDQTAIWGQISGTLSNQTDLITELNTRDTDNRNRSNHTGTQSTSTIVDLDDFIMDTVNTGVLDGTGITTSYDAGTHALTVAHDGTFSITSLSELTTPESGDYLAIWDATGPAANKKISWTNLQAALGGGSAFFDTVKELSSNFELTGSATYTDVTDFVVALEANKQYYFQLSLFTEQTSTSPSFYGRMNYTGNLHSGKSYPMGRNYLSGAVRDITAANQAATYTVINSNAIYAAYFVTGYIKTTTAGNLSLQIAQSIANGGETIYLGQDSIFLLRDKGSYTT